MWSLLHAVGAGAAERHRAVLGRRERATPAHAARVVRDYVEHFGRTLCGGDGGRERFVREFDGCGLDRCRRLGQHPAGAGAGGGRKGGGGGGGGAPPDDGSSWREFSLWMFELHHEVTLRLREERNAAAAPDGMWPSPEACPRCRDGATGGWDGGAVLEHLKAEYWPSGVQNWRYVVLDRNEYAAEPPARRRASGRGRQFVQVAVLAFGVPILMIELRRWHLLRSGRHKKFDDAHV